MTTSPEASLAPTRKGPLVVTAGLLAALVAAGAVNALIAVAARAGGAPDDFRPLTPGAYLFFTAGGLLAGAAGWALIRRFAPRPARLVHWLAPAVVLVSFVPDFFLFGDGGALGVIALLVMHVVVGVVAVAAFRRVMPLPES